MAIEPWPCGLSLGHAAIDRQRAEQGDADEHQGRERGEQPGRQGGDARLVAERGEVVDAGQAHHPPPGVYRIGSAVHAFGKPEVCQEPIGQSSNYHPAGPSEVKKVNSLGCTV